MFDKDKFKTSLTNYDIGQAISHFNGESFEGENGELISTTCVSSQIWWFT